MLEPNDLIERAERETGCRVDDPNNNMAMAILFGALSRELGQNHFQEKDDLAAGIFILDEIENGDKREKEKELLVMAMKAGWSHGLLKDLLG
jgi:hypothetical protein